MISLSVPLPLTATSPSEIVVVVIVTALVVLFPIVIEFDATLWIPPVIVALAVIASPIAIFKPVFNQLPFELTAVVVPAATPLS
jgi:hypothetical protein